MESTTQDSIRQLAAAAPDRNSFYLQFLPMVASQTNAISGIAWSCRSEPFLPICQTRSNGLDNLQLGVSESEHAALLSRAAEELDQRQQSLLIRRNAASNSAPNHNPVIVLSVVRQGDSIELVEMFYPQGLEESTYQQHAKSIGFLCRAATSCELPPLKTSAANGELSASLAASATGVGAGALAMGLGNRQSSVKNIGTAELDEYVHQIHGSLDPSETAKEVANEMRRVLDCDRVTVVQALGRRYKIVAVSGQPSVNQRSNIVYLLRRLVRRVLPTKQTFWYPSQNLLPQEIDKPLQAYLGVSATRSLVVAPIFDRSKQLSESPNAAPVKQRIIGGVVIEHCSEQWNRAEVENAVEVVTRHAGDAFRNSYNHRQLLFYPIWKWLGKSKVVLAARNLPKTIAAALALLGIGLLLTLCPANLKVTCDGILVPEHRSKVFVPLNGTVSEIKVKHGEKVESGDLLLTLINNDLENEATELAGRIDELNSRIKNTETMLLSPNLDDQELGEQNLNAQKAQLDSLQRQQTLVKQKLGNLSIFSPHAGQVVTWNLENRLKSRPVSRGEELMEIVDVDREWQLELDVPSRSIGHIQKAFKDRADNDGDSVEVEFILAADPENVFNGKLVEIGKATVLKSEIGPSVNLKIKIDDQQKLDIRQIKSSVSAKVICRKTTLGYSMFHGVSEFIQKHWFRFF